MELNTKWTNLFAFLLLCAMGALMFFSLKDTALTYDELAHIPAGYSYLKLKDYRINPEHPPLAKDLAALPLQFMNLHWPKDNPAFSDIKNNEWWIQYDTGTQFIWHSDNDPFAIILAARLPMIALTILLGLVIFIFARRYFGNKVALLSLFFYAFCPNFLAHGRLVTTDIGATFGIVLATMLFLQMFRAPNLGNIIWAGLGLGIAFCFKFSTVLLIPFLGFLAICYAWKKDKSAISVFRYIFYCLAAGLIAVFLIIIPLYHIQSYNEPLAKLVYDANTLLEGPQMSLYRNIALQILNIPVLRPLGIYLIGFFKAGHRTIFGNTTFFMGQINNTAWWQYFPVVYAIKTPLAIFVFAALGLWAWAKRAGEKKLLNRLKANFEMTSLILWILIYWAVSVFGNLNIGIRHLLPAIPFMMILIAQGTIYFWKHFSPQNRVGKTLAVLIFWVLIAWYAIQPLRAYPDYISYFNELVGSMENGRNFVVDSNVDWGQDFYKLNRYVQENGIRNIKMHFLGGSDPQYFFGAGYTKIDRYSGPQKGWIAISATYYKNGTAIPLPEIKKYNPDDALYYSWLRNVKPAAIIGRSIYLFKID